MTQRHPYTAWDGKPNEVCEMLGVLMTTHKASRNVKPTNLMEKFISRRMDNPIFLAIK